MASFNLAGNFYTGSTPTFPWFFVVFQTLDTWVSSQTMYIPFGSVNSLLLCKCKISNHIPQENKSAISMPCDKQRPYWSYISHKTYNQTLKDYSLWLNSETLGSLCFLWVQYIVYCGYFEQELQLAASMFIFWMRFWCNFHTFYWVSRDTSRLHLSKRKMLFVCAVFQQQPTFFFIL